VLLRDTRRDINPIHDDRDNPINYDDRDNPATSISRNTTIALPRVRNNSGPAREVSQWEREENPIKNCEKTSPPAEMKVFKVFSRTGIVPNSGYKVRQIHRNKRSLSIQPFNRSYAIH
jgi:hypothetical protein